MKINNNKILFKFWSKKMNSSKSMIKTLLSNTTIWLTTVASACVISAIVGVNLEVGRDLNDKINTGLQFAEASITSELNNIKKLVEITAVGMKQNDSNYLIEELKNNNSFIKTVSVLDEDTKLDSMQKTLVHKSKDNDESIWSDIIKNENNNFSSVFLVTPIDSVKSLFVEVDLNSVMTTLNNHIVNSNGFYLILKETTSGLQPIVSTNDMVVDSLLKSNVFNLDDVKTISSIMDLGYDYKYEKTQIDNSKYYFKIAKMSNGDYIVSATDSSTFDARISQIVVASFAPPVIINIIAIYVTKYAFIVLSSRLKTLNKIIKKLRTGEKITDEEKIEYNGKNEMSILNNSVNELVDTLEKKSKIDGLTKIANRRYFDEMLAFLNKAERKMSLLMIDVDYFKKYNDGYGHLKGDEVLQSVAKILKDTCSDSSDLVARFGGEEFAIIMADKDEEFANQMAQNIIDALHDIKLEHKFSDVAEFVTVSIGVSTMLTNKGIPYLDLVKRADEALYEAKLSGRDRYFHKDI